MRFLFFIILISLFLGCDKEESDNIANDLIGIWQLKSMTSSWTNTVTKVESALKI